MGTTRITDSTHFARFTRFTVRALIAATSAIAFAAQSAAAQTSTPGTAGAPALRDARWSPWVGCWTPQAGAAALSITGRSAPNSFVCVVPAGGGVDVVSIVDNRIAARERVVADGARIERERDGCRGWESAAWSGDNGRVLLASEYTCPNNLTRRESGIFSMSPAGEWLDVQGVNVAGNMTARVTRLFDAGTRSLDSARALLAAAGDNGASQLFRETPYVVETARMAAGAPLDLGDVAEASKQVGATVTQAWITEVGQGYALDARSLGQLADAGVPAPVLDLMIALSHPKKFTVKSSEEVERLDGARGRNGDPYGATRARGLGPSYSDYVRACLGMGRFSSLYGYGYGYFPGMFDTGCSGAGATYGYSRYGYGYGGYGYGYPYGNAYYGNTPVIIITNGSGSATGSGNASDPMRAVRGRGYTRGGSSADDDRRSGSSTFPSSTGGGASARTEGSSSGGSSGGGSSGSSSGRTAKARGG